jgi:restriction endonuclease S subunit
VARGFEDIISGSSQPQITKTNLGRVMVYYPPLTVQRNIAAILDKADEVKTAIKELPAILRSLVDSTFLEMFGDPRGCEGPTLANFASVESGNGFPLTFQGEIDNKIPFYKVSDMNLPGNEKYMLSHNNSVSMETVRALRLRIFPPGSVIFPKIGAAIATNKKRITTVDCCVDNNVIGIIPDSTLDSEYLHSLLQFKDLNEFASSSSPPSMRKTDVEGWNIPGHSISEQNVFSEMVVKISQLSDTSPIAEFLQKSIAQELFT